MSSEPLLQHQIPHPSPPSQPPPSPRKPPIPLPPPTPKKQPVPQPPPPKKPPIPQPPPPNKPPIPPPPPPPPPNKPPQPPPNKPPQPPPNKPPQPPPPPPPNKPPQPPPPPNKPPRPVPGKVPPQTRPPFPLPLPPLPAIATESETSMLYSLESRFVNVKSDNLVPAIHLSQMGKKTDDVTVSDQKVVTLVVADYLRVSRKCLSYCVSVNEAVKEFTSKLGVVSGSAYIREFVRRFQFPDSCSLLTISLLTIEAEQVLKRTCDEYKRQATFLKRVQFGKRACDVICLLYLLIAFICSIVDAVSSPKSIIETIIKVLPIPALFGSLSLYLDGIISDTKAKVWVFSAIKTTMLGLQLDLRRCETSHHKAVGVIGAESLELFEMLVEEYKRFYADDWFRFTFLYPREEYHQSKAYILAKAEDVVKFD